MKLTKFNKLLVTLFVVASIFTATTTIPSAIAYTENDPEYHQEHKDKAHWMADCMRSIGWDEGTEAQKAALAQCGVYWHTHNDLQKECIQRKEEEAKRQEASRELLGTFQITAYEWTGSPCANGRYPTEGYTVACNSLPLGTRVYIEGVGERVVEDRGASWHASNWMDLYLGDVASCSAWGVQNRTVYRLK